MRPEKVVGDLPFFAGSAWLSSAPLAMALALPLPQLLAVNAVAQTRPSAFHAEPASALIDRVAPGGQLPSVEALGSLGAPHLAIQRAFIEQHRQAEMAAYGLLSPTLGGPGNEDVPALVPTNFGGKINTLHTDLSVHIDPSTGSMTIDAVLTVESNDAGLTELSFGVPKFKVIGVLDAEGHALKHKLSKQVLDITLPAAMAEGDVVDVRVQMEGTPNCSGGQLPACKFGAALNYVTHADYFPRNVLAGLDLFTADLRVTVPAEWVVAGTGTFVGSSAYHPPASAEPGEGAAENPAEVGDGERIGTESVEAAEEPTHLTFHFHHPFETTFLSFAMGNYQRIDDHSEEPPVSVYVRETNVKNASTLTSIARSVISLYERLFSPFPFASLDIVEIHNSFSGGYGPQATIMMASNVFGITPSSYGYDSLVQLESHEIGHQWWGNLITLRDTLSIALNEGLAEFSSALHYEMEFGTPVNFVTNGMSYLYTVPRDNDVAIGSPFVFSSPFYTRLAYDKASVVFNMLRHDLGDDVFFEAMSVYAGSFGRGAASIHDFVAVMEDVSGRDLSGFFGRWMFGTQFPDLAVTTQAWPRHAAGPDEGATRVDVTIEQLVPGDAIPMLLELWLDLDDEGRTRQTRQVRLTEKVSRFSFELPSPLSRLHVDPNRVLLQRTYPAIAADMNMDGEIDGRDFIDLARRQGRNIVYAWNGQNYFYPNPGYLPRFDLNRDGYIDRGDVDQFLFGEQ